MGFARTRTDSGVGGADDDERVRLLEADGEVGRRHRLAQMTPAWRWAWPRQEAPQMCRRPRQRPTRPRRRVVARMRARDRVLTGGAGLRREAEADNHRGAHGLGECEVLRRCAARFRGAAAMVRHADRQGREPRTGGESQWTLAVRVSAGQTIDYGDPSPIRSRHGHRQMVALPGSRHVSRQRSWCRTPPRSTRRCRFPTTRSRAKAFT